MNGEWKGKRIWIAGNGVSGTGAYQALTAAGAECAYFDQSENHRAIPPDLLVVSPGIAPDQPVYTYARENGIPLCGELEIGYLLCDKPIVAVTGTNGKTTVTRLIGAMLHKAGLAVAVCGNVGKSFALAAATGGFDVAVVECSSFQLETIRSFRPHIAVLTNISPDHLNRYNGMEEYCAAKRNIARNQTEQDVFIFSQDDVPLYALRGFMPKSTTMYTTVYGKVRGAYVLSDTIYYCGQEICRTDRVKMEGEHNLKNALSAVCAAKALGIPNAPVVQALTEFAPDAHRLCLVARKNGKNFYNDSKGTNIMASVRAAECMNGTTCMIVGGSDKGYEFDELFQKLPACVVRVAAVGETAQKVTAAAERNGFCAVRSFSDFTQAFLWAKAGEEENVLLSPASASFDMFSSYAERGELFERLVQNASEE
ncbi:MAG: UDP-N-acetylmuramoyl-L-alanine--D-glutamate ligase [Clostridia bacterium]|nr:UDP-N-acetylmuramoyl-L-alanine--D-glutamate ligase [Clostridia bacterium]